ncbi:MAG TPA: XrtB/PEP-CTERM-associated transcriptional regulator EpsA [Steroidobacteraceae bacterium]|nr:XrtB/PEP-CTERM-associated transcriptional regulator EpsA [Steroidobacteraceae bacterium]
MRQPEPVRALPTPAPAEAPAPPESGALLDAHQLELLLLNIDASLRVHTRAHFFIWTQGLLQSLIPHRMLLCAWRSGEPPSLRIDSFSTFAPDAASLGGLLQRSASIAPGLVNAWRERQFLPLVCETGAVGKSDPLFASELQRIGATQLVVQGSPDANGEASTLFLFACDSQRVETCREYLLQLLVPFLHCAWVRSQMHDAQERAEVAPAAAASVLTTREREILRWIYLGKSNGEVGAILRISPLTVKNHVQKILRKLNVVNRTQAVGKALDSRILVP